ncbi:MAG: DUF4907 domain-containing protein [Bacteroidetes bacterium]|nr:DUF4907 domain-containing protein [Bacteroidota bacterium]MCL2303543.1 DUF4907 domain-containing protein [Lentimicrobiaceae bacterium]
MRRQINNEHLEKGALLSNIGFITEKDAMKVAELVVKKIRNNEMPPTVTIQELQELEVTLNSSS